MDWQGAWTSQQWWWYGDLQQYVVANEEDNSSPSSFLESWGDNLGVNNCLAKEEPISEEATHRKYWQVQHRQSQWGRDENCCLRCITNRYYNCNYGLKQVSFGAHWMLRTKLKYHQHLQQQQDEADWLLNAMIMNALPSIEDILNSLIAPTL